MKKSSTEADLISGYRAKQEHTVIGIMSGTSLDGIDAVLVSVTTDSSGALDAVKLVGSHYLPYSEEIREIIARLCQPGEAGIPELTRAHFGIGRWYAEAVRQLLEKLHITTEAVDAVSMHGQTVWHAPEPQDFPGPDGPLTVTGTLQIGNAQVVAAETGLPVISDLRSADMAVGGEGAPMAPFIDYLLFADSSEGRAVQNIGGIGNVTVLPKGSSEREVYAFDTGPGNMVIDAVIRIGTDGRQTFDDQGAIAAGGTVSSEIVEELLTDPFFAKAPPKSTGREVYGQEFSRRLYNRAQEAGLSFPDIAATATAFTAETIARAYRDFVFPRGGIARVLICGGGARNRTLLQMLQNRMPSGTLVETTDSQGVPDSAREAMAFALMGHQSLMGRAGNLPKVTGARKPVVLGTITMQNI